MPSFNANAITIFEINEADAFGTGGRTTVYRQSVIRVVGADRHHAQVHKVSNDVSAQEINISPLGSPSNVASGTLLFLQADNPIDLRVGSAGNTPISAVQQMVFAATVSSLFVTTSNATYIRTELVGGSGAAITVTLPLP